MAEVCRQILAVVSDKVGRLAELTDKLKGANVNIQALCAWVQEGTGHLMMLTGDNDKACAAIRGSVDRCEFGDVVCAKAPNKAGALNAIAHKLAEAGIAIRTVYATAAEAGQTLIVLSTSDNAKAAKLL